jgi:hypothetical protein
VEEPSLELLYMFSATLVNFWQLTINTDELRPLPAKAGDSVLQDLHGILNYTGRNKWIL